MTFDYKNCSLLELRDRLLPGLWSFKPDPDYESDLSVDFGNSTIWIKVYRFSTKKLAKYEIKRDELPGIYAPKIKELFEELK